KVRLYAAGHLGDPAFLRGLREVRGARGYCAQESPRIHFGVDSAQTYDIEVRFGNGTTLQRTGLGAGIHTIDARPGN
ncbi:MAG TPA: ASPIC/UnbV domain-containing protein, partial [Vicinamibacteria bacterium]